MKQFFLVYLFMLNIHMPIILTMENPTVLVANAAEEAVSPRQFTEDLMRLVRTHEFQRVSALLALAAEYGLVEHLRYYVREGGSLRVQLSEGKTLAHVAARFGQIEMLNFLREEGLDINACDRNGLSVLHEALFEGHATIVEYLYHCGSRLEKLNYEGEMVTPLQIASAMGQIPCIIFLHQQGAPLEEKSKIGATALHYAARRNQLESLRLLVQSGADINAVTHNKESALHYAAHYGHLEIIRCLIDLGMGPNIKSNSGYTPLHAAVRAGNLDAVRCLLDLGADENVAAEDNELPIHSAAMHNKPHIIAFFHSRGISLAAPCFGGLTPLHCAVAKGNLESTECLIELGAGIHSVCETNGASVLQWGVLCKRTNMLNYLLARGSLVDYKNRYGQTALHIAARLGFTEGVTLLLLHGATINVQDNSGYTPLDYANHVSQVLLNWQNALGVVRAVVEQERRETIALLRRHGAKTNAELQEGPCSIS